MDVNEFIHKYKKSKIYSLHGVVRIENVIKDLEQLRTIEYNPKVKIPKFVAEWLEIKKKNKDSLHVSIDGDWQIMPEVMKEWLFVEFNDEVFARAWLDGYEVEEEPKYYVKIGNGYFSGYDESKVTYVLDNAPGELTYALVYDDKHEAETDASDIGGEVVLVEKEVLS